ncbi:MAG: hypothetical protein GF344_04730 [Chitinivibrionales bacterium]|nr:hypothetical protein [Chitinivibrionales bacterium]
MQSDTGDLNLPIVTPVERRKQVLSMDDFDSFNQEDMEIAFDREAYLKEKKRREVPVPFTLSR